VCSNNSSRASIRLLREFMFKGKSIFRAVKGTKDDPIASMQKITLDELRRQMPQVFFSYVADLEVYAPTAHCLEQSIPALKKLREEFRYLESEAPLEFIDNHSKQWRNIFNSLENWSDYFSKCQKELN